MTFTSMVHGLLKIILGTQTIACLKTEDKQTRLCYPSSSNIWSVNRLQSAWRTIDSQLTADRSHSAQTAMLTVQSDILLALNCGNLVMLTWLDLSATFDSVDFDILLHTLQSHTVLVVYPSSIWTKWSKKANWHNPNHHISTSPGHHYIYISHPQQHLFYFSTGNQSESCHAADSVGIHSLALYRVQ